MLLHSTTTEPLTAYSKHNDTPGHKHNVMISMTRTDTQGSAASCNSTTELVPHYNSTGARRTFSQRLFSWNWHQEKLCDSEKNESGMLPIAEKGGGPSLPPVRFWHGWQLVVLGSWLNVFIVFIPATWVLTVASASPTLIFICCVLAFIPLVKLHDLCTAQLATRLGGAKTGLLNASLSNTVELVVAIIALLKCELRVVQASLIGSMLSKMLLVLGMCFFAGGTRFSEQGFDHTATQIHSSLLSISVGAVLLPAAFHFALSYDDEDKIEAGSGISEQKRDLLRMSHGVSIVLLFIYASYLVFQLWSHTHLFSDNNGPSKELPVSVSMRSLTSRVKRAKKRGQAFASARSKSSNGKRTRSNGEESGHDSGKEFGARRSPYMNGTTTVRGRKQAFLVSGNGNGNGGGSEHSTISRVTMDNGIDPDLKMCASPAPPVNSTVRLVHEDEEIVYTGKREQDTRSRRRSSMSEGSDDRSFQSDSSSGRSSPVDSVVNAYIDERGEWVSRPDNTSQPAESADAQRMSWTLTLSLLVVVTVLVALNATWMVDSMDSLSPTISKEWIGLILLPTVSSIAECMTAMNVSVKDQLTLSISVAVGSTIQTALFVIPAMVILGWVLDKPLALLFDPFESVVLYISVHTMSYVVSDGKSNWLEGVILVCLYIVIAVTFWFYPGSNFSTTLAVCADIDISV